MANRSQATQTAIVRLAVEAVQRLGHHGAYIHCAAVTTPSIYIKFSQTGFGSLRISDHQPKRKLNYTWNLILGGEDEIRELENGRQLYFASEDFADQFFAYMDRYMQQLEGVKKCNFALTSKKQ